MTLTLTPATVKSKSKLICKNDPFSSGAVGEPTTQCGGFSGLLEKPELHVCVQTGKCAFK
jgi:hypothetical protein